VEDVRPNGPGGRAGLRPSTRPVNALGYRDLCTGGDVVVSIDGQPVRNADDLVRIVSFGLQPGAVSVFTIIRDGHRKTVAVTLGDRDKAPAAVRAGVCGA
jgi:S1-C subfamily serine protease